MRGQVRNPQILISNAFHPSQGAFRICRVIARLSGRTRSGGVTSANPDASHPPGARADSAVHSSETDSPPAQGHESCQNAQVDRLADQRTDPSANANSHPFVEAEEAMPPFIRVIDRQLARDLGQTSRPTPALPDFVRVVGCGPGPPRARTFRDAGEIDRGHRPATPDVFAPRIAKQNRIGHAVPNVGEYVATVRCAEPAHCPAQVSRCVDLLRSGRTRLMSLCTPAVVKSSPQAPVLLGGFVSGLSCIRKGFGVDGRITRAGDWRRATDSVGAPVGLQS